MRFLLIALVALTPAFAQDIWSGLDSNTSAVQDSTVQDSLSAFVSQEALRYQQQKDAYIQAYQDSIQQAYEDSVDAAEFGPPVSSTSNASVVTGDSANPMDPSAAKYLDYKRRAIMGPRPDSMNTSSSSQDQALSSSSGTTSKVSARELLGPVKVSRVRGIDELKGRYKSPRKALFMSLVLPGAGQLYVGGSSFNITRGVLYMATEAVLGAYWYHYSVRLYDRQVSKYESFARNHYSIGSYEAGLHTLYGDLSDVDKRTDFSTLYLIGREEYCSAIYRTATTNQCFERSEVPDYLTRDQNHTSQFPNGVSLDSSLKAITLWDESRFYQIISREEMVLGWDDVDSLRGAGELDLANQVYVPLGASSNLNNYIGMRQRANELADMQAWFLGGILLNHIVSAVDATLAAHAHNKGLYEEKIAWYDRVRLQSGFQWTQGLSGQVRAHLEF